MSKLDWTVAPEDAQFYSGSRFRKHDNGLAFYWSGSKWYQVGRHPKPLEWHRRKRSDFEMRPTTQERAHPAAAYQYEHPSDAVERPMTDSKMDAIGQNGGDGEHYSSEQPEWRDAPDWANWVAQDASGVWGWHESKPCPDHQLWTCTGGSADFAGEGEVLGDWRDTLEKRPESKPDQEIDVLDERQKTYGDFSTLAETVQVMEYCIKVLPGYDKATPGHREAAHMIIQKLVRAMNGDPHYADTWHDISGYARLAEKECEQ